MSATCTWHVMAEAAELVADSSREALAIMTEAADKHLADSDFARAFVDFLEARGSVTDFKPVLEKVRAYCSLTILEFE